MTSLVLAFMDVIIKVKCTLVQALRLCTGSKPIGGVEV
jgi:hypothetical protein